MAIPRFELTTSLAYHPPDQFTLLPRHLKRLKTAHQALAAEMKECWCARVPMPSDVQIKEELKRSVGDSDMNHSIRIRLVITKEGLPQATTFPLTPMPPYPVRVVFDSQPTDYGDPFLRYKTTHREEYDEARRRQGANLIPSRDDNFPPFDVIMFNTCNQLTETTISNIAFRLDASKSEKWITPESSCGLLPGVQRAELLENGELLQGIVTIDEAKIALQAGTLEICCFNGVRGRYPVYIAISAK